MRRRRPLRVNKRIVGIVCGILVTTGFIYYGFRDERVIVKMFMEATKGIASKFEYSTKYETNFIDNMLGAGTKSISEIFDKKKVVPSGNSKEWYEDSLDARGDVEESSKHVTEQTEEDATEEIQEIATEFETEESIGEGAEADVNVSKKTYVTMPEATGIKYSMEELSNSNFIISKFFTVPTSTKLFASDVNINNVMSFDGSMKQDNSKPQILIYHTHSMEGYTDTKKGDISTGIVGVGDYLTTILTEQFGYNVIHLRESFDVDENGYVDRANAYTRARKRIVEILSENPTIEVILDVHRDGVDDSLKFVTKVNEKDTAKIMFFNGLCRNSYGNPYGNSEYREENLALSLQMKLLAEEYYPSFTRKNYVNAYHYNMNLREKSMLIEVGAQTNTLEEAKNAMEPLAVLLNKVLN